MDPLTSIEPLSPEELRVVGCLIEKEATVPESYPLTLNALRLACNQTSNRDPIVDYPERVVEGALAALKDRRLARFVYPSHGGRSVKYRHVLHEALGLDAPALAVLSVLVLRGPQTAGELRGRTERQHAFAGPGEVEAVLEHLAARPQPLAIVLPRQPGRKEARWMHLLGGPVDLDALAAQVPTAAGGAGSGLAERVAALEEEVAELRRILEELGAIDPDEASGDR